MADEDEDEVVVTLTQGERDLLIAALFDLRLHSMHAAVEQGFSAEASLDTMGFADMIDALSEKLGGPPIGPPRG